MLEETKEGLGVARAHVAALRTAGSGKVQEMLRGSDSEKSAVSQR